jgi:Mycothiol maleylpyruvate isomerase N-terminal domain
VTVETYLDHPAEALEVPTAAAYYLAIAATLGSGDPAIGERGRQAGAAMGADPAATVHELVARVDDKLTAYDDEYLLTTIAGGMRLDEYLRTRIFELVVHGLDISAACGVDPAFAEEPLVDAATLAAEVAARSGRAPGVLLALTGRASLPPAFTIL